VGRAAGQCRAGQGRQRRRRRKRRGRRGRERVRKREGPDGERKAERALPAHIGNCDSNGSREQARHNLEAEGEAGGAWLAQAFTDLREAGEAGSRQEG
jgi:hypothetical protein